MRRIILVKQHPSIQLGHLYEHLFCTQIKQLLYENGLFKYVDFSLDGTTFDHGGFIEIDMELYTPKAISLANQILKQKISFNEKDIICAFTQLLAEEEQPMNSHGYDKVFHELEKLETQPWENIDDFDIFDAKTIRTKSFPIYTSEGKDLPSRKITTKLCIEPNFAKTHRKLIPLFRQIAKVLAFTANDRLAMKNGYYCGDTDFISKPQEVYMKLLLQVADGNEASVDTERDLQDYLKSAEYTVNNGAFDRLFADLRSTSYRDKSWLAPNTHHAFDETAVYIGVRGWKRVATKENLELLLKHMSIEIKFGRKKVTAPLLPKGFIAALR